MCRARGSTWWSTRLDSETVGRIALSNCTGRCCITSRHEAFRCGGPIFLRRRGVRHSARILESPAAKQVVRSTSLGYYDPVTNRIYLYDVTAGQADPQKWHVNAETIIHEAAHQTAFNIGIHPRFATSPAWVVEGSAHCSRRTGRLEWAAPSGAERPNQRLPAAQPFGNWYRPTVP